MEWMYAYMAGIAPAPAGPGFGCFLLRPHLDPTGKITQVLGSHESPYGEIRSEWEVDARGRTLTYVAVVPANSGATLRLPTASADTVREGHTPLARVDGVRFLGHAAGSAAYHLPSGQYRLTAELR
ncbi:alpha-L-rhamnosidase C-terminal domain-containing protein [Streptomyces sp. NPDC002787]